jgi:hypothetical protein
MRIRATRETILAKTMEKGERKSAGGIVIPDDDGTDSGITIPPADLRSPFSIVFAKIVSRVARILILIFLTHLGKCHQYSFLL